MLDLVDAGRTHVHGSHRRFDTPIVFNDAGSIGGFNKRTATIIALDLISRRIEVRLAISRRSILPHQLEFRKQSIVNRCYVYIILAALRFLFKCSCHLTLLLDSRHSRTESDAHTKHSP